MVKQLKLVFKRAFFLVYFFSENSFVYSHNYSKGYKKTKSDPKCFPENLRNEGIGKVQYVWFVVSNLKLSKVKKKKYLYIYISY